MGAIGSAYPCTGRRNHGIGPVPGRLVASVGGCESPLCGYIASVTRDVGRSATGAHRARSTRRAGQGEHRLPPAIAILVAIVLYALLPEQLLLGPRLLIPFVEAVLLVVVLVTNPRRLNKETRISRTTSLIAIGVVLVTNIVALALLVHYLVSSPKSDANALLLAALQVWATNVIAFGLLYWELDRGGPVSRSQRNRDELPQADFRFPQDEDAGNVVEVAAGSSEKSDWMPTLVDYLYVSTTNSSAFSPTDTMPLSSRAKVLMGTQATAALLTSLLVIARAVGALGG